MELFYDPYFTGSGSLIESESKHCINVLRHKEGDTITVTDGKGTFYKTRITNPHPKRCELELISSTKEPSRPYRIHIAIAPTKNNDRLEWMVEKAVEMGVDEITLIICHHSERRKLRLDRIEKVVISASKQSLKANFATVNDLIKFSDFIKTQNPEQTYIAHCRDEEKQLLKNCYNVGQNATILIGPEGDFSEAEIKEATEKKITAISLGSARLRTETAGLVACHSIHFMNQ